MVRVLGAPWLHPCRCPAWLPERGPLQFSGGQFSSLSRMHVTPLNLKVDRLKHVLVVVLCVNPLGTSRWKRILVTGGKSVQSTDDGSKPTPRRLNIKWWRPPHWLLCCPRTNLHSSLRSSDESVTSKRAVCPSLLQKGMVAVSIYQARSIGDEMCVV